MLKSVPVLFRNTEKMKAFRRKSRPPRPQNKEAIIAWFNDEERVRSAGLDPKTNKVANWFHGKILKFSLLVLKHLLISRNW